MMEQQVQTMAITKYFSKYIKNTYTYQSYFHARRLCSFLIGWFNDIIDFLFFWEVTQWWPNIFLFLNAFNFRFIFHFIFRHKARFSAQNSMVKSQSSDSKVKILTQKNPYAKFWLKRKNMHLRWPYASISIGWLKKVITSSTSRFFQEGHAAVTDIFHLIF